MAEQNPIKYSDLISPDDSISKLIGELENLQQTYVDMTNAIKAQASSVAASLKTVSGATVQGQQTMRNAASEADRLAKAERDLAFARSETAKKIQELKMAQQEENRMTKLQIILNNTAEGSYAHLSAQYSLNKIALNKMTAAERENVPEAKKLEEETRAIYEEMKRLQEATGKYSLNVGNYANSITSAIGVDQKWLKGMQDIASLTEGGLTQGIKTAGAAVTTFGKSLLALLANPIVLTIAAITAAFMALAKGISTSEENTNALSRIMAPFKRVLEGVLNVIQNIATGVLKVVEGFENLAMGASRLMERLPLVGSAFKKVNDELQKSIDLERERQQLQKDGRKLTKEDAKMQYEVAVLRRKAQETDDPKERAAYLSKAVAKERQMSDNRVSYIKRELAVLKEKARQSQNDSALNDEIARKEAELWNARTQAETRSLRMVRQIATANKQMNAGSGGKSTGGGRSEVDLAKQQLEETRKLEDARIALIDDANMRERMTILASYDRKIEDLKGSEQYIRDMTVLLEQQKQQKLAELLEKEAQQQREAEKKDLDARLKATDDMMKKREQAIREGEQAIARQYELETSYADLEQNENKKTDMRLKAEKKRLEALLDLYQKDGKILTDAEVQTIKNSIAAVDQEIEKNTKGRDLYDILGFEFNDEQKQALSDAFSFAIDQVNAYMDAVVRAAERKVEIANGEVENAKRVLDAELEARSKGYASNVAEAQKELEMAKKNQQKALQEQRRAQKAQQDIDTAVQTSSLITATANIWKSFSGTGPWGIAAAIAAIATMWGSFTAAKIKAAQVTKSSEEEYGEGTVELLQGGSHQSGRDVDLGTKPDGTRRRAEGGEFFAVINKRNSRKYRREIPKVINSLNDGTFAQKYTTEKVDGKNRVIISKIDEVTNRHHVYNEENILNRNLFDNEHTTNYREDFRSHGISKHQHERNIREKDITKLITLHPEFIVAKGGGVEVEKYQRAYDDGGMSVNVQGHTPDLRGLSEDVRQIREQGERSSSFDANGNEIVQYKNLRRLIRQ